jgi:hypothetical protein
MLVVGASRLEFVISLETFAYLMSWPLDHDR